MEVEEPNWAIRDAMAVLSDVAVKAGVADGMTGVVAAEGRWNDAVSSG